MWLAEVAPPTGDDVVPLVPMNHWKSSGSVPPAWTVSVAVCPAVTDRLSGCAVMNGAVAGGGGGGAGGGGVGGGGAGGLGGGGAGGSGGGGDGPGGGGASGGAITVTVAVAESAAPFRSETRTQKLAVLASAGVVKSAAVAPAIGCAIVPLTPANH